MRRRGGWGRRLREAIAKGWARYKFTMTDKQAFRDKLMLPTASINVFLTSLTHVGLANIGSLMVLSGQLPVNAGAGSGQVSGYGGGWGATTGGGVIVKVGGFHGWGVVGRRVAFKENIIRKAELMEDIEDEVVEYVKYLVGGGLPFNFRNSEGGEAAEGRYRITKTTKMRTRSRSKSRGPLGLGKESRTGQMYVVRKKSVSRPSTERIEIVEREFDRRSEGEGRHRKYLALPAPPAPEVVDVRDQRQPQYVERKPKDSSRDGWEDSGSDSGRDSRPIRRSTAAARREIRRSETPEPRRDTAEAPKTERPSVRAYSGQELKARTQHVRQRIAEERARAIEEIEQKKKASRTRARMFHDETLTPEEKAQRAREEEIRETMEFLDREYGLIVTPVEVPREPIDNGRVKPVEPPSATSGFTSKELSDSEESDTPIMPGMSRTDKLRAETSLPEYSGSRRDRPYMSKSRYEPYSTYDREKFRRSRQSYHDENEYPPPPAAADIFDDGHRPGMYYTPPTPLTPPIIDDGHGPRNYHTRPPHDSHDHYSGEDFDELRPSRSNPNEDEPHMIRRRKEDKKRSSTKPTIIVPQDASSHRLWRMASDGGLDVRHEPEFRRRERRRLGSDYGQDGTYMRGAIGSHGSDDEPEDHMRIVRR